MNGKVLSEECFIKFQGWLDAEQKYPGLSVCWLFKKYKKAKGQLTNDDDDVCQADEDE